MNNLFLEFLIIMVYSTFFSFIFFKCLITAQPQLFLFCLNKAFFSNKGIPALRKHYALKWAEEDFNQQVEKGSRLSENGTFMSKSLGFTLLYSTTFKQSTDSDDKT